jgi:hypothetical protein
VDWIDLVRDRDQWRALVNTVMNLWVHPNWDEYWRRWFPARDHRTRRPEWISKASSEHQTITELPRDSSQRQRALRMCANVYKTWSVLSKRSGLWKELTSCGNAVSLGKVRGLMRRPPQTRRLTELQAGHRLHSSAVIEGT